MGKKLLAIYSIFVLASMLTVNLAQAQTVTCVRTFTNVSGSCFAGQDNGGALTLGGASLPGGLYWDAPGGTFTQYSDGTATLTGTFHMDPGVTDAMIPPAVLAYVHAGSTFSANLVYSLHLTTGTAGVPNNCTGGYQTNLTGWEWYNAVTGTFTIVSSSGTTTFSVSQHVKPFQMGNGAGDFQVSKYGAAEWHDLTTSGGALAGFFDIWPDVSTCQTVFSCPGNVIVNPSFETGTTADGSSQTPPQGWVGGIGENPTDPPFVTIPDGNAFGYTLDATNLCQTVATTPGSTVTLSFYAGVHEVNGQTVTLQYMNGTTPIGSPVTHTITYVFTTGGGFGGPYNLSLPAAPSGTTGVRVCANHGSGGSNTFLNAAKIDAVCMQITTATCSISALTAVPGACVSTTNKYSLTGSVTFANAPATGKLVVKVGSDSVEFNAPFTSPQAYTISNLVSDGASHTVVAYFTADAACTMNQTYTAPASCGTTPCGTPQCGSITTTIKRK